MGSSLYIYGMAPVEIVVDTVEELGPSTADDLEPILSIDGLSRKQIVQALQNANYRGMLRLVGRRKRSVGKGSCSLGVYEFIEPPRPPEPPPGPRWASVWDYAQGKPVSFQLGAR